MSKTVRQWFQELPQWFIQLALTNMTNPDKEVEKMSDALGEGVKKWETTPEGREFWQTLYFNYRKYDYPDHGLRIPESQRAVVSDLINMKKILKCELTEE